jgi:hypothetical protein
MTWHPFEDRRRHRFRDEEVFSCYLGKVWHFREGRNVWGSQHGLFSGFLCGRAANKQNIYPGFESFAPDLVSAKERIRERRKRGSQWTIFELPAVVISGAKRSLLLGDINSDKPLSEFSRLKSMPFSLESLGLHFEPRRADSVFRIVCRASQACPATLPFRVYHSVSHGGQYRLEWSAETAAQDIGNVLNIVHRMNNRLQHK